MKAGCHHLARQLLRLSALLLLPSLGSCKLKSGNQDDPSDLLNPNSPRNKGLALIEKKELYSRPGVHAVRLDEIEFRVNALRVGEQTFLRYDTPVLSFELPNDADYVDILRCPSKVIIYGGADDIDHVETGAKDGATETKIFQRNNFWEVAAQTSGCVLAASSYTDVTFEDASAPSGKFHYYLRACVDQQRLIATDKFTTANCSRQVTRTPEHTHTNKRGQIELEALLEAAELRNKIDTIGRQIVDKTMLLNDQLYDCQQRHNKRVLDYSQKTGIANILKTVLPVGLPFLGAAVVGLYKQRNAAQLSYDGSKRGLQTSLRKYNTNTPLTVPDRAISTALDKHITGVETEITRLTTDRTRINARGNPSPTTLESLDAQITARQTELSALRSERLRAGAIGPNNPYNLTELKKLATDNTTTAKKTADFIAATGMVAGASSLISSVYEAGSQPIPAFPKDADVCYNKKNESKIASQTPGGSSGSRPDTALICSCADAMATQIDLGTLATDLQQQTELYQAQLDTSHLAREAAEGSANESQNVGQ